tara:strand:- start:276 stop:740 length:465 start_codon:yes stop_codon:yes gene_type:complete
MAQEKSFDQVNKTDGSSIEVKVTKVTEDFIEYNFPEETLTNQLKTSEIVSIVFASGRTQNFNKKAKRPAENISWENVKVFEDENQVTSMEMLDDIEVEKSKYYGAKKKLREQAIESMQKEAAAKGGHAVLITNENFKRVPINTYTIEGFIYKEK